MTGVLPDLLEPLLEPLLDPDECDAVLERVVTGALPELCDALPELCDAPPDDDEPDEWEPLLDRVLTGALVCTTPPEAAELPEAPPLERVLTAPLAPADPPVLPPAACEPLAPVRGAPPAARLCGPRPPVATAPRGVGNLAPCSWRTTCTVRRMTCVRYWTAGERAASVATGLSFGRSVYTAKPPAAIAVMAAALRVYLLRIRILQIV